MVLSVSLSLRTILLPNTTLGLEEELMSGKSSHIEGSGSQSVVLGTC